MVPGCACNLTLVYQLNKVAIILQKWYNKDLKGKTLQFTATLRAIRCYREDIPCMDTDNYCFTKGDGFNQAYGFFMDQRYSYAVACRLYG